MIQKTNVLPLGKIDPRIGVANDAGVARQLAIANALIIEFFRNLAHCGMFGRSVQQQQLPILVALGNDRGHHFPQICLVGIEAGNHQAEQNTPGDIRSALGSQFILAGPLGAKPCSVSVVVGTCVFGLFPVMRPHCISAIYGNARAVRRNDASLIRSQKHKGISRLRHTNREHNSVHPHASQVYPLLILQTQNICLKRIALGIEASQVRRNRLLAIQASQFAIPFNRNTPNGVPVIALVIAPGLNKEPTWHTRFPAFEQFFHPRLP